MHLNDILRFGSELQFKSCDCFSLPASIYPTVPSWPLTPRCCLLWHWTTLTPGCSSQRHTSEEQATVSEEFLLDGLIMDRGGASIQRQWRDVQTSGSGWVGWTPSSQCSGTSLRPKKLPQKWDVESRTPAHTVGGLVRIPFPLSLQNTFECNCQPVCQSRTCYSCFQPCVLGIMYLRLSLVERWIFLYLAESGQRKCFWFLIWFWFGLSQKKHISLRTAKV